MSQRRDDFTRGEGRDKYLRCWRLVSERCVRPDRVVVPSPALDDDLGLVESVEDFAVEQLVAQASVEALDVAVLPGATPLDVGGLETDNRDPSCIALATNSGPLSDR